MKKRVLKEMLFTLERELCEVSGLEVLGEVLDPLAGDVLLVVQSERVDVTALFDQGVPEGVDVLVGDVGKE